MSTFSLYFRSSFCHYTHFEMSQKSFSCGKSGKFTIDLDDDDDELEIPSDEEVEISEDQRIMDELVFREHERSFRASERRWIRSQTEGNTFINSSKNILH